MDGFLIYIVVFIVALSFISAAKKNVRTINSVTTENLDEEITQPHIDKINSNLPSNAYKHDSPEAGYVILNGIKRKLEDCKYL